MSIFEKVRPLYNGEKITDGSGGSLQGFRLLWQQLVRSSDFLLNSKQDHDTDLDGLSALSGTGLAVRTGAGTWTTRTLAAGTGISITDPSGVGGNPTITSTVTGFTDEAAQDAVGAMVDASLTYVDATPLLQRAALTGDVTAAAGSNATTIANDAVTFAKMLNATGASVLVGRGSASGGGDFQEITLGSGLTMTGTVLSASGGSASWIPLVDGAEPPAFITDGAGVLILVAGP